MFFSLLWGLLFLAATYPNKLSTSPRQGQPISFPHEMHMESYECETCHHDYDNQKNNVLDTDELYEGNSEIRCAACHTANAKISVRQAYHQQCIGCHEEENRLYGSSTPIWCNECHIDKKKIPEEWDMVIGGKDG